ncbi:MAG: DUF3597 domain-containing protein [Anaerolineaceae bacterium]|nr:DUF3597 domain-containing protein [Anaerolineaceae bacterium]
MGLFANILEKLGLKKPAAAATAATTTTAKPTVMPGSTAAPTSANFKVAPDAASLKPANAPTPIEVVDVVSKLEKLAKANPQKLDWKVSIVDLLKLLDLDSSLAARKELAAELGCPAEKIGGDYSEMNVWLHKTVLKRIADNGGNIPASLLK